LFESGSIFGKSSLPIYLAPFISMMIVALRIFHPEEYVRTFKLTDDPHKKYGISYEEN
jgi:hypothetical protein